jgi:glycosyltransferase involved in cell wall biosynthesis
MRIAQLSPLFESVPPRHYGGTERVVSWLTEELVALGHDVTLFATADSVTAARLEPGWSAALRGDPAVIEPDAVHLAMIERVCRRAREFDVIHSHVDYLSFPISVRTRTPMLATLHGRLDRVELPPVHRLFPDVGVVSISDAQRRPLPSANWVATIHHGLPPDLHAPGRGGGGYLAFLGRVSPEKGLVRAIRIAESCGRRIRIAAKIDEVDRDYFNSAVVPLLRRPGVEFLGEIGDRDKSGFLGEATALLLPISWPEPFGLVMIEAMACGTPVITYDAGSAPELIDDGVTGFVVANEDEAVAAVERAATLPRARIRERFEQRFSARRMAEQYVALYKRMAGAAAEARPAPRVARAGAATASVPTAD